MARLLCLSSLLALFLTVRADTQAVAEEIINAEPEVMSQYGEGVLKCYDKDLETGAVSLKVCSPGKQSIMSNNDRTFMPQYPYCMMFKFGSKITQMCMTAPSLDLTRCGKTACVEFNRPGRLYSECCCFSSGCNGHMTSGSVLELPDV